MRRKRICFVTGTRAEWGLMRLTLDAIRRHSKLKLQIVATGMHLNREHGHSVQRLGKLDAVVPWRSESRPIATGVAIADLAKVFRKLKTDVVLVVGDRVEAFAAAAAAHLSDIAVAHIHGGDRALGQADDSLRHATTKLAHVHFPATITSARRIARLGEDSWRIHGVGSPGIEDITQMAGPTYPGLKPHDFLLLVLHPIEPDDAREFARARMLLRAAESALAKLSRIVVIYPNNDPGCSGIIRCWKTLGHDKRFLVIPDTDRAVFLGLLRDASVLVGNSSAGIIEAASFGTPVVDIGPRQDGRERNRSVIHVQYSRAQITVSIRKGMARPRTRVNVYQGRGTSRKIADILGRLHIDGRLIRKIVAS